MRLSASILCCLLSTAGGDKTPWTNTKLSELDFQTWYESAQTHIMASKAKGGEEWEHKWVNTTTFTLKCKMCWQWTKDADWQCSKGSHHPGFLKPKDDRIFDIKKEAGPKWDDIDKVYFVAQDIHDPKNRVASVPGSWSPSGKAVRKTSLDAKLKSRTRTHQEKLDELESEHSNNWKVLIAIATLFVMGAFLLGNVTGYLYHAAQAPVPRHPRRHNNSGRSRRRGHGDHNSRDGYDGRSGYDDRNNISVNGSASNLGSVRNPFNNSRDRQTRKPLRMPLSAPSRTATIPRITE